MRLAGEHRRVYSSAAGRHVGTSERGGSERNGQRPPPVITDVNYVRTRTSAAGRYVHHGGAGEAGGCGGDGELGMTVCAMRVRDGAKR